MLCTMSTDDTLLHESPDDHGDHDGFVTDFYISLIVASFQYD